MCVLQLLLHGRASRASDVYAYGILLWDLATGQRAFAGTLMRAAHGAMLNRCWKTLSICQSACWVASVVGQQAM
jgi:hypothetical protein